MKEELVRRTAPERRKPGEGEGHRLQLTVCSGLGGSAELESAVRRCMRPWRKTLGKMKRLDQVKRIHELQ